MCRGNKGVYIVFINSVLVRMAARIVEFQTTLRGPLVVHKVHALSTEWGCAYFRYSKVAVCY